MTHMARPIDAIVRTLDKAVDSMSYSTYPVLVGNDGKPLIWMSGEIKTPPFSSAARIEAGTLLRRLQLGENIGLPHARPMPSIGRRCYELRVRDEDAIVIVEVFAKKSNATPQKAIEACRARSKAYDRLMKDVCDGESKI